MPDPLDPFDDLVSDLATPGFKPYTIKHPSGLVADHYGTHLSIRARGPHDSPGEASNLVSRVVFNRVPQDRSSSQGWPSAMDALDALDQAAKQLSRSGLTPHSL